MALREIRVDEDPILGKVCKPVKEMTDRIRDLINDMYETMYAANGVGLAAPQVGILRRIFVVDIGDGVQYTCINPEITVIGEETQTGDEGCLSVPGKQGIVTRALKVHVEALNADFEPYAFDAEDLLARAMQHEYDHLDGILYTSKVEGELSDIEYDDEYDEEYDDEAAFDEELPE